MLCQGQWKAAQGWDKRFFCAWVVEDALVQVLSGFNAYATVAQLFELARLAECGRPLHEVADHGASRAWTWWPSL